jgi:hypothetical protein
MTGEEPTGGPLVLRHAGKRSSGSWGSDDYDVLTAVDATSAALS